MFKVPEKYRVKKGMFASDSSYGNNGMFFIYPHPQKRFECIASDGKGWEHVSVKVVSYKGITTPTWNDMCYVRNIFWDPEDTVIQFHPTQSEYVNVHDNVLHLWRPINTNIELPPNILV